MNKKESQRKNRNLWPVIYGILLVCYAVFALLDAFVIPRDMVSPEELQDTYSVEGQPDNSAGENKNNQLYNSVIKDEDGQTDSSAGENENGQEDSLVEEEENVGQAEPIVTKDSYTSEHISINISTLRQYDTQIYVADVVIKDISYLKAGLAGGIFGRNIEETTSAMAEENNAILAINGDYYGFRDNGFVMRNGFLYRDTARRGSGNEDMVIYQDGSMEIFEEAGADAADLEKAGALQIFSFGPGLIQDSNITVDESSEVEQSMRSNPRTAIGMIEPLHYLLVVSDGRTKESAGLTLLELAQVMKEQGCQLAYNFDGGGSSTMWFMGKVINNPTTRGNRIKERSVSDIVYIGE